MAVGNSQLKEKQHTHLKEPGSFKVVMHNDDFTTMDFVVMVLKNVFFQTEENANILMLRIHETGKAVVGVYTYDIAFSKMRKATEMAYAHNFPLRLTIEEE